MKNAYTDFEKGMRKVLVILGTVIIILLVFLLASIFSGCKTASDWYTLPMAQSKAHLKTVKHIKSQKYCHFPDLYEYKFIKKQK